MKKKKTYPTVAVKLRAVRMFIEEKKSQKEIAEGLGIALQSVKNWVWIYRRKGEVGLMGRRGRPSRVVDKEAQLARLKMENELLKKFHTELRKVTLAKRNIG
ncbi:MAG: helix-turn-helix domain-containing protein [Anaerolineales bacterium]|nr:helix-turn-helix domain-containing protein [Anaerolineales bacterium]